MDFKPLPPVFEAWYYGRSIVIDVVHRMIFRRRRDRARVSSDYDQGEWSDQLREARWRGATTLDAYLVPQQFRKVIAMVDGRLTRTSVAAYYRFRGETLRRLVATHAGDTDMIVELGCGAGRNLFTLAGDARWRRLIGFDISPIGLSVVEAVKARFAVAKVEAHPIDLLGDLTGYAELRGATVLTYLCLEQLPAQADGVLRRLVAAGVRRGIHIEPSLETFRPGRLRDLATICYIRRQDYQRHLLTAVRKLEAVGSIRLVTAERPGYSPGARNEPMLIVWEATA